MTVQTIVKLMQALGARFTSQVYTGDCGMVAIALCKFLGEQHCAIWLFSDLSQDELEEEGSEPDIYHVVTEYEGHLFDAYSGITTTQKVFDIFGGRYAYSYKAGPPIYDLIRTETDWKTSWQTYLQFLKKASMEMK
jgi:hypothetical protein